MDLENIVGEMQDILLNGALHSDVSRRKNILIGRLAVKCADEIKYISTREITWEEKWKMQDDFKEQLHKIMTDDISKFYYTLMLARQKTEEYKRKLRENETNK